MGEPSGVGGEIAVAAWRARSKDSPAFYLADDPARIAALGVPVATIARPADACRAFTDALPVLECGIAPKARPGAPAPENAQHVIRSIETAVGHALGGEAAGVVTNPIQKSVLIASGFRFPGHTEFLGALCADAPMPPRLARGPVMMLAGPSLRTVPLTVHTAVRNVPNDVTTEKIIETAIVVISALREDFAIPEPRLTIAGLNPHAGEGGALGAEDRDVIAPAVAWLRDEFGADVTGPLPADTMFHESARAGYDAALCMYHDQALIPVKTIAFHDTVNVTLGLPIVRTSPDHGTALDLAGTGRARPDSLIAALKHAAEIAANRERNP